MSGFFGVFSPGGNLDQVAFDQMKSAIHRDGYDELDTLVDDDIAMGHLMLRVTPESIYDKQPLKSDCGRYTLVGYFRLDYRDELGDKLGFIQEELELTPDSLLVLKSYQKWGNKCVQHLEGDWAFAVYDKFYNTIFFAKDPTGVSALFYTAFNSSLYFSSDPSVFSKSEFFPLILDENQFAFFSVAGLKINKGSTLLKNLRSLQNGFTSNINSTLQECQNQFYDLDSVSEQKKFRFDFDVAYDFKSIYFNAVKSRCRSQYEIGLFLSAGLDSMSVATISSFELKKVDRNLNTFTSVPSQNSKLTDKEKAFADESSLVKLFVGNRDNVQPGFFSFDDFKLSNIDLKVLREDPFNPSVTLNSFWINGILNAAKNQEVRLVMTGQMGNFTLSAEGYLVHLSMLFRLQFSRLFVEMRRYADKKGVGFLRAIRIRILNVFKYNLRVWFKGKALFSKEFFLMKGVFLLDYYIENKNLFKLKSDELIPGYTSFFSNRKMRIKQLQKNLYYANVYWFNYGKAVGVDITDPTSDKRVIDFSLSISDSYFNKHGVSKYLYKKMFADLIPNEILKNPNSMIQSFDYVDRLKEDKALREVVMRLAAESDIPSILKVEQFSLFVDEAFSSSNSNYKRNMIDKLLHNISTINYLLNFKKD
jgi:asparagine synthase (glutamine-hydrolysing)